VIEFQILLFTTRYTVIFHLEKSRELTITHLIMLNTSTYYVIAPIDGLHLDFDYRMYSAEVYGCPPNYVPNPDGCSEFRQPYEYLGSLTFKQYTELSYEGKIDNQTLRHLEKLPDRKLINFTCIAFEINLDREDYLYLNDEDTNNSLFQYILNKGEQLLDVWRLCLFKPGEDFTIGSFGAVGNGIQCFWLGQDDIFPKFIARRISRYQLVQQPLDVLLSDFGTIYADITFRNLCYSAFNDVDTSLIKRIFNALRAFRESRDIPNWEARFRHLAVIAESLAKKEETEHLRGNELRERIAKIASNGWEIYKSYNSSVLSPPGLQARQYRLINKRYKEMGWKNKNEAQKIIKDLWDNVRNPLSHTVNTVTSLKRNPIEDMVNIEKIIVTMINGICTAYEVEEFYGSSAYDIILDGE